MRKLILLVVMAALVTAGRNSVTRDLTLAEVEALPGVLEVTLPGDGNSSPGYRWAFLELAVDLPAGSEMQLWRDVDLEDPAWESDLHDGLVSQWVMDDRTGTRVRLDVSKVMRSGRAPTGAKFYLRVLTPRLEPDSLVVADFTRNELQAKRVR